MFTILKAFRTRLELKAASICAAVLVMTQGATPAPSASPSTVVAKAYANNDSLSSYTFQMHASVAMHHFPWMHFTVDGEGQYEKGVLYQVRITKAPFFAKRLEQIDLSFLSPSMWRDHYDVRTVGSQGDDTQFQLTPRDAGTLSRALVTVNPSSGIREINMEYADGGRIRFLLRSDNMSGYLLPATTDIDINAQGTSLSAHADFSNYSVVANCGKPCGANAIMGHRL